jgi:hypothetical protein
MAGTSRVTPALVAILSLEAVSAHTEDRRLGIAVFLGTAIVLTAVGSAIMYAMARKGLDLP